MPASADQDPGSGQHRQLGERGRRLSKLGASSERRLSAVGRVEPLLVDEVGGGDGGAPTTEEALQDYNKKIKRSSSLRRLGRRRSSLIEEVRAYYISGAEEAAKDEVSQQTSGRRLSMGPKDHAAVAAAAVSATVAATTAAVGSGGIVPAARQLPGTPRNNGGRRRSIQHPLEKQDLDPEFYSDKALLQRESLKFDPDVRRLLEEIFLLVDQNADGRMDFEEYRSLFLALWRIVRGSEPEDRDVIRAAARREFKVDAFGKSSLDKAEFKQLVFQIVDTWTESITAGEYCGFLQELIDGLKTFAKEHQPTPIKPPEGGHEHAQKTQEADASLQQQHQTQTHPHEQALGYTTPPQKPNKPPASKKTAATTAISSSSSSSTSRRSGTGAERAAVWERAGFAESGRVYVYASQRHVVDGRAGGELPPSRWALPPEIGFGVDSDADADADAGAGADAGAWSWEGSRAVRGRARKAAVRQRQHAPVFFGVGSSSIRDSRSHDRSSRSSRSSRSRSSSRSSRSSRSSSGGLSNFSSRSSKSNNNWGGGSGGGGSRSAATAREQHQHQNQHQHQQEEEDEAEAEAERKGWERRGSGHDGSQSRRAGRSRMRPVAYRFTTKVAPRLAQTGYRRPQPQPQPPPGGAAARAGGQLQVRQQHQGRKQAWGGVSFSRAEEKRKLWLRTKLGMSERATC